MAERRAQSAGDDSDKDNDGWPNGRGPIEKMNLLCTKWLTTNML